MISRKLVLGAVALSLAAISRTPLAAGAPAEERNPPKESFEKYQVILTNNIFVRERSANTPRMDSGPVPAATALSPEEATALRGIVRQGEGADAAYFIFLEDVRTQETTKMRVGDPVCAGKLVNPTLDSVDYVKNGVTTRIEIGKNLTGADAAPASVAPAAASPAAQPGTVTVDRTGNSAAAQPLNPSAGPAATKPPASPESIAEQMRQKRLKELGQ
jgi:hypothetical protein